MISKKNISCAFGLFLLSSFRIESYEKVPISEKPDDRINFPSNFQVEAGANLFIAGDYLYWVAQEDSLYYAHTGAGSGTTTAPASGSIDFDGRLEKIHPHWNSGVRAALGLNFPKEGYDLMATWTWFSSSAKDTSTSNGYLLPLWTHPDFASTTNATEANAKWDLNLNIGDLEWGRSSWFGGSFSFRPFFGLRGVYLEQGLKNYYSYNTSPVVIGELHLDSDFRGGGLRAGADGRFCFPHGFSLYGQVSGSLLLGSFSTDMHFEENSFTIAKVKDCYTQSISTLQLALGLSWDSHFFKDRCHIEFHIGWEQNSWFHANQMNHFLNDLRNGSYFKENSNLTLQGLIAGGRFDF